MSGNWRYSAAAISPDPYVDWAAGAAFNELDAETGGRCRYLVVKDNGERVFVDLGQLKDMLSIKTVLADLAGPLPPDSIGVGFAVQGEAVADPDDSSIAVIVGIIDDAIAFANERFCKGGEGGAPLTTRFEAFWLQDGCAEKRFPLAGYGREFAKSEINGLLAAQRAGNGADEDALYRDCGVTDMGRPVITGAALHAGHGTHVLDVASGFSPVSEDRDAKRHALIGVQLPHAITRDTSGKFSHRLLIDALDYIIAQAEKTMKRIGRRVPVIVNLSYGIAAGPHDGSLDVERGIDRAVNAFSRKDTQEPLTVVAAAGNGYLDRTRAKIALAPGQTKDVRFSVLPDDRTSSFLEVWLPEKPGDAVFSLSLKPAGFPASTAIDSSEPGNAVEWADAAGNAVCKISYLRNDNGRGWFFAAWQPTIGNLPGEALAPSGWWTVSISQEGGEETIADLWIQRDDSPFGFRRRGRQAYFDDPDYVIFDPVSGRLVEEDNQSLVKRAGSVNAYGCGQATLVIGGFMGREGVSPPYSAAGDTGPDQRERIAYPDAAAVSDDSRVHSGVLGAGTRSGSVFAMNGTSVAAPQVTRLLALEMAQGRIKGATAAKQWLHDEAGRGGYPPVQFPAHPPAERYGKGRVPSSRSATRTPARFEPS